MNDTEAAGVLGSSRGRWNLRYAPPFSCGRIRPRGRMGSITQASWACLNQLHDPLPSSVIEPGPGRDDFGQVVGGIGGLMAQIWHNDRGIVAYSVAIKRLAFLWRRS